MSIEAMKQALGALDGTEALLSSMDVTHLLIYGEVDKAITELRAAIEEAKKQEPVGWVECDGVVVWYNRDAAIGRDLYTTPPQLQAQPNQEPVAWFTVDEINEWAVKYLEKHPDQKPRQWQGLTDEEIAELHHEIKVRLIGTYKTEDIYRAIEAKLKEKNHG